MPRSTNGTRRLWQGCLAGLFLGLIAPAGAQDHRAPPAASPPAAGVEVEVANGLLTLRAAGAPLAEVLRAIGAAGSFEVVLRGSFATPVRESFADQPLEDAIRGLVKGHSVVIRRGDPDPRSGAADLAGIRVIENPARAASDDAARPDPGRDSGEVAEDDAADGPPMDREAFRLANLWVSPPTKDDI